MIEIDGHIVSLDILTEYFLCDVSRCDGICCVEGNSGAPLEAEEMDILRSEFPAYAPFMTPEGIASVDRYGYGLVDADGDLTTPLVDEAQCAYSCREGKATCCAVEKAWHAGSTHFRKPVSCHLYPIRIARFSNGTCGLNYHRWDVCAGAVINGKMKGVKVYQALREPLIRRFGEDFYLQLEAAAEYVGIFKDSH